MNITLQKEHQYFWDGVKVPGVTEVLTKVGIMPDWSMVNDGLMADARLRGLRTHRAVELWEAGTLDSKSLEHPELVRLKVPGYFDGYRRFRDKQVEAVIACERIVGHSKFRYCGRLDLFLMLKDGRFALIDLKTGEIGKWMMLQAGAYLEALQIELGEKDICYGALKLNKDGTYDPPEFTRERKYIHVFLSALTVVAWRDYS